MESWKRSRHSPSRRDQTVATGDWDAAAVEVAGTAPRSVCLWARVDKWRKAALFGYGTETLTSNPDLAPKPGACGLAGDDDVGFVALDFGDGYPVKAEVPARAGQWNH